MKTILSYGGGVNSTALIALAKLGEIEMPDYIVFSDTGAEWPHTYKYIEWLESQGIDLIYLTGGNKCMTLIELCQKKSYIPSRMNRWCTDYYKKTPVSRFARGCGEHEMWIGIDAGESHRAVGKKHARFPLIELDLDRNACKEVIKKAGMGVPLKSGCFICPFQRKRQWIELKRDYPKLWKIAVDLEKNAIENKEGFTFIKGMKIDDFVSDLYKQKDLDFGYTLDQKCECYFN